MRCPMAMPKSRYAYKSPLVQCKGIAEPKPTCFPTDKAHEVEPDVWITPIAFQRICLQHAVQIAMAKVKAENTLNATIEPLEQRPIDVLGASRVS